MKYVNATMKFVDLNWYTFHDRNWYTFKRPLTKPFHFSNEPTQSESIEMAKKCGETFINYYAENKIYFNSTICEEIDDFNSNIIDAWTKYLTINSDGYRIDQEGIKQWRDSWNTIREKVPIIRSRIENLMREMLGVDVE